jgi:hypothetical protein
MNRAPDPVARIAEVMATFKPWWALCGGWAVDAWLGGQSRDHLDVDIAISHDDHHSIFDHLREWELIAHDHLVADDSAAPWDGRELRLPAHIHGRKRDAERQRLDDLSAPTQAGFSIDIQLTERSGNDVLINRDPRIVVPLSRYVGTSDWGLPALVPEVMLFYKARESRPHDEADFDALLPHVTLPQRKWLRHAINRVHPGHAWLRRLSPEIEPYTK